MNCVLEAFCLDDSNNEIRLFGVRSPKKHRTKRQRRLTCILDRKLQKYINEQIFISIYNYRWYKITVRN